MEGNVPDEAAEVGEETEETKDNNVLELDANGHEKMKVMENNVPDVAEEDIEGINVYDGPVWRNNPVLLAQFLVKLAKHVNRQIKRQRRYRNKNTTK